jgi:hypothetical protein
MMKKYMFVLILFISFTLPAITPSITFGIQDSTVGSYTQGQFYIDITLTQPIGNLNIYGNYRNEMNLSRLQPLRFAPKQDYFTVGASYDTGFVTIRAEHMCMHPVISQSSWSGLQGGYTRFEITLGD